MRGLKTVIVSVLVVLMAVALVPSDGSEGSVTVTDGSTWYCYGDHPTFTFPDYTDGVQITWVVTDASGDSVEYTNPSGNNSRITVDLAGYDRVTVTQNVSNGSGEDSMTITVIPLHLSTDEYYTVVFHDGSFTDTQFIDNTTVVEAGDDHVILPLLERDGYDFLGWFHEDGRTEFDPTEPITGDTHVYAKWNYSGISGGSSQTITVSDIYTVTFNADVGLECVPGDSGSSSLTFSVNVLGGYQLIGSVSVTTTNGILTQIADGEYLLSGINGNAVVTVSGDAIPTDQIFDDNPNTSDSSGGIPMWMWLIVLVVILLIAAAVLWMRGRQEERRE